MQYVCFACMRVCACVCVCPTTHRDKQQALQYVNIKGAWLFGPSAIKMYVRSSSSSGVNVNVNVKERNSLQMRRQNKRYNNNYVSREAAAAR